MESELVYEIDEISIADVLGRRLFVELNKCISVSLSSYFLSWSNYSMILPDIIEIPIHSFPSIAMILDGKKLTVALDNNTTPLEVRELVRYIAHTIQGKTNG